MTSAAQVGGGRPVVPSPHPPGRRSASRTLVGREDALARLESLLDEAVATERLTPALLEGPAGIGKTRVVDELAARLAERGVDVLVGHCVAQGAQTLPYAPLVEALSALVRRDGALAVRREAGPAAVELGRLVPALLEPGEEPAPLSHGSSRLFQALSTLLQRLSSTRPLVLVVEDVHWSDTSTRELLAALARQQPGAILLLLTLRTDESPAPTGLTRYVAELARRGEQRVRLDPLTRDQQALQISDIRGLPPRRELLDDIYTRAEGNPFFAEELLALGSGAGDLPSTIRDLLLARLEALEPATRQLLRTASLAGRVVPYRLLEAVVDVKDVRLESALREAVEAHVLQSKGEALVFRHALLQEAIAASMLPGETTRAHRRLAETLTASPELAGRGSLGVAGRVARHWDAAGEPEQALVWSVTAGREACDALAFVESLTHYERALELLDSVPDGERLLDVPRPRLLRWAAEVAHLAAHPLLATRLVREAIADADPDDDTLRGWLHERLGRYLWMAGDGHGALAAYEQAVALVPEQPPTRARAAVLSGLSQMLMLADRYAESEELAQQAIEVARLVPDGRSIEGHARCNLGVDLAFLGRVDEGIAELRLASRIAEEELDDVDENARALVNLDSVLLIAGRVAEAADVAIESVRVGDELGLRRRKGVWCRCDAAQMLTLLGRVDEAAHLLLEARELDPQGVDSIRVDLTDGELLLRRGALAEARACLERARSDGERLLDPQLLGPLYATLAECAGAQGDAAAAYALVGEGLTRLPERWHPFFEAPLLTAGIAAAMAHDPPLRTEAEQLLARAEASADSVPWRPPHVVAALSAATAELSGSAGAWAETAARYDALADPYRCAEYRIREARALLADADREAAADRLSTAVRAATTAGAEHLLGLAADLGRRSRLRVLAAVPDDGNPYRLTRRELDVLALVAEGLTDRAIGGRLYISHRTVERHVSNLLAKLDAGRRSELVATAHREGLLGAD